MKAVLLCAGFATRLRPLTTNFPKPLLAVGGVPILERLVDQIVAESDIREFWLVSNGRFAAHFEQWRDDMKGRRPECRVEVVNDGTETNETRLGAVRDLGLVIEEGRLEGPLLVAAGDNLFRFPVGGFVRDFQERERNLILVYREKDLARRQRSGVAELGEDMRILRFWEKAVDPPSEFCCPPLYGLQASALGRIESFLRENPEADAPGSFISWLAEQEPVYGHEMHGERLDVGDVETYRRADAWLRGEA